MSWLPLALPMTGFLLLCPWSVQNPGAKGISPSCWCSRVAPVECPRWISIFIFLLLAVILCLFYLLLLCLTLPSCFLITSLLCCPLSWAPSGLHFLCLPSPAFPTHVALEFNLSGARYVSWCPSLQSVYLALNVFAAEPLLGTYIMAVPPQRWGKPDKIKLIMKNWVFIWKFAACRAFQLGIGKRRRLQMGTVW